MHSLFLRGARVWGAGCHVTHSSHNSTYVLFSYFLFIGNIPKQINYIIKYLDSRVYRLLVDLVGDGQSSLMM